jgi:isopentenyldiphosphate isomerase
MGGSLMEYLEIFDENGTRKGRVIPWGTEPGPGEFLMEVHVWIRDEKRRYLVYQKPAPEPDAGPGPWVATVGYVLSGESSLLAAIREAVKKLGIKLTSMQLNRLERIKREGCIEDIWLAEVQKSALGKLKTGAEVAKIRWATKTQLEKMIGQGEFTQYSYFSKLPK